LLAKGELCPKKKGKVAIYNHDFLVSAYQQAIVSGLALVPDLAAENKKLNVLHLGTGAGVLPMFL
jgi:hypothetical protein